MRPAPAETLGRLHCVLLSSVPSPAGGPEMEDVANSSRSNSKEPTTPEPQDPAPQKKKKKKKSSMIGSKQIPTPSTPPPVPFTG